MAISLRDRDFWLGEADQREVEEIRASRADGLRDIVTRAFDQVVFGLLADLLRDRLQSRAGFGLFRERVGDFCRESGPIASGRLDGGEEGGGRREAAFLRDHVLVNGGPCPDGTVVFLFDVFRDIVLVGVFVRSEEAVLIDGGLEVDMRWGGDGYLPFPDRIAAFEIDGERKEMLVFADGCDLIVDDAADFDAG